MGDDPDEEEIDGVNIGNDRKRHWRMVFKDNDGGVDDKNTLVHANRWDVYVNEKGNLIKVGYSVEVVGHDVKKVLRKVVENHVVEEATDHDDIGLRGFGFNFLTKTRRG